MSALGTDDVHEQEREQPSEVRKRLSAALLGVDDSKAYESQGEYGGVGGRRASSTSSAFAMPSVDGNMPFVPILICGQLFFEKPLDVKVLRDTLKARLCEIPRFRCTFLDGEDKQIRLRSIPLEKIDMEYHLKVETKPDGKRWVQAEVDQFLSRVYKKGAEGLDYSCPPWRFYVFAMEDSRTLLLPVIDHALVDGIASVAALLAVLDDDKDTTGKAEAAPKTRRVGGPPLSFTGRVHALLVGIKEGVFGPVLPADKPSILKEPNHRKPSQEKSNSSGQRISLDEMKRIKSKFPGATINDIMLATLTITIKNYFKEQGQPLFSIRGNFPVNLRPAKENPLSRSMGNRIAPANFTFPLNESDPTKIVWNIKGQVDTLKASPATLIIDTLFQFLMPRMIRNNMRTQLAEMLLDSYGKVTVMLSNVPGPGKQASLCGQPVVDLQFYAMAPIGVYFGILSYNGGVYLGVTSAATAESNAAAISKHWAPAFAELVRAVDSAPPAKLKTPSRYGDLLLFTAIAVPLGLYAWKEREKVMVHFDLVKDRLLKMMK